MVDIILFNCPSPSLNLTPSAMLWLPWREGGYLSSSGGHVLLLTCHSWDALLLALFWHSAFLASLCTFCLRARAFVYFCAFCFCEGRKVWDIFSPPASVAVRVGSLSLRICSLPALLSSVHACCMP